MLPFLVPYGVLPASMIFVLLYTFMSIHLSRRALFNIIVVCFTLYFCLFTVRPNPNPNQAKGELRERQRGERT